MNRLPMKLGLAASLVAFVAIAAYGLVQTLQVTGTLRPPWDAILIYLTSLFIATPYLLTVLSLHAIAPEPKRILTHAAILFAAIYTVYVTLNYTVQLGTVIPSTLRGTLSDVKILDQTPHSLFWDVDALGYIFLGFSTLFAAFVFDNTGWQRWGRYILVANAAMDPVIAVVYFYPTYSTGLLLLGVPWLVTATTSMLVFVIFFAALQRSSDSPRPSPLGNQVERTTALHP
jgi:hypothetical protein